MRAHVSQYNLM